MLPILSNAPARRLFLDRHALAEPPAGPARGDALHDLIDRLGLVQLDSINTVERAHHMILFARRPTYRPKALKLLAERDRRLFEHWTHDASILPIGHFPHWKHRFRRDTDRLHGVYSNWHGPAFAEKFDTVLRQIAERGPVTSGDVGEDEARGSGGWWNWHPSKAALEYLWRTGRISVLRRDGFIKVYDLTERVIPADWHAAETGHEETITWACSGALDRLGFATSGEIAAFYKAVTPEEAKHWCAAAVARGEITEIAIEGHDGSLRKSFARPDVMAMADTAPEPPPRVRVLSPFDPALRDRNRAERLFGFFYRIEVFVPEAKRQYGYYVFPLLEGDRLIGRVDMKADRAEGVLRVRAFWPERGVRTGSGRLTRIEAELARVADFAGCDTVAYAPDWLRAPV
jgi:uncharacterized protein YcaQ